jgi:hypothetical protein
MQTGQLRDSVTDGSPTVTIIGMAWYDCTSGIVKTADKVLVVLTPLPKREDIQLTRLGNGKDMAPTERHLSPHKDRQLQRCCRLDNALVGEGIQRHEADSVKHGVL